MGFGAKEAQGRMFETLFGVEIPLAIRFAVAFLSILVLIGVAAWVVRLFAARAESTGSRGRHLRLAVVDSASVDDGRLLILVRRDNVEHLMMIGGPTDLVIEPNIECAVSAPPDMVGRPAASGLPPPVSHLKRLRPPQMELAGGPRPQRRIEPLPQAPPAWPLPPPAETPTGAQRDTLAALADELSAFPVPLHSTPRGSGRAPAAGSHLPTVQPPPVSTNAHPDLLESAHGSNTHIHSSVAPADEHEALRGLNTVEHAPPGETGAPPHATPMAEPKPTRTHAKASRATSLHDSDSIAREMASLLGRFQRGTGG